MLRRMLRRLGMIVLCLGLVLGGYHFFSLDGVDGLILSQIFTGPTEYAAGYSPWRFWRVRKGMSTAEVEKLLGAPINTSESYTKGRKRQYWLYSTSPVGKSFHERLVIFGEDGRVEERVSKYSIGWQ